jgi:hypothetical protein
MMNRFSDAEDLAAATRAELPRMAVDWLAALRGPLEKLTTAALSEGMSDEEFLRQVETFIQRLPELFDEIDHDSLAALMESSMGAAMANGIAARIP